MRLRIWGRLAAAVLGAAALADSASAQTPAPVVVPHQVVAQPAPGPTAPTVSLPGAPAALPPAAAASVPVTPAPGTTVVTGSGGCATGATGGTAHRGFLMSAGSGYYGTNCRYGQPCNNGCGSLRSDLGVVFGSCKSFFAPCGPTPCGKHGGNCNHPVIGPGASGPFNPCVYDSYLNH